MALPRFIFLKSDGNKKYLRYLKEAGSSHAYLRFSEDLDKPSRELQYIKFQVERSGLGDGLVHLKTCYNNKYLARKSPDSNCIVAEANEAEEDQSKWSCTLFKPVPVDDKSAEEVKSEEDVHDHVQVESWKIRLVHVDDLGQRNAFASKSTTRGLEDQLLVVGDGTSTDLEEEESGLRLGDVFTVYNATLHCPLPLRAAFKGPENKYASPARHFIGLQRFMQFNTTDICATGVAHRVFNTSINGQAAAFIADTPPSSRHGGWGLSNDNFVINGSAPLGETTYGLYVAVSLGGNLVALRNLHNGKYIVPASLGAGSNYLCAQSTNITKDAMLQVEEAVLSRTISDIVYHLDDVRMYDRSSPVLYSDSRENDTSVPQAGTFRVVYEESHTTFWRESVSFNWGVSVRWDLPRIPFVGSFGIEVGVGGNREWEWGAETTKTTTIDRTETVTVPPGKRLTLRVVATRVSYDIPFSFTVNDLLMDGTTITRAVTGGLFTGTNGYDFTSRLSETDIHRI